jgi:hypothetical protein
VKGRTDIDVKILANGTFIQGIFKQIKIVEFRYGDVICQIAFNLEKFTDGRTRN